MRRSSQEKVAYDPVLTSPSIPSKMPSSYWMINNVNRSNERKRFHSKKKKKTRSEKHPVESITHADCSHNPAHLANAPAQIEFLLHSLEPVARGIGLNMNSDKTEFICFNQDCVIYSLKGNLLELMDQFRLSGDQTCLLINICYCLFYGMLIVNWFTVCISINNKCIWLMTKSCMKHLFTLNQWNVKPVQYWNGGGALSYRKFYKQSKVSMSD